MVISSFRIPRRPEKNQSINQAKLHFSYVYKNMHFFRKRDYIIHTVAHLDFFHLTYHRNMYTHTWLDAYADWQGRRRQWLTTMWTFTYHLVYFTIPVIGLLYGRPNQIKEGQVLYRSTFGIFSARVLVLGTANRFQILGDGVELNI